MTERKSKAFEPWRVGKFCRHHARPAAGQRYLHAGFRLRVAKSAMRSPPGMLPGHKARMAQSKNFRANSKTVEKDKSIRNKHCHRREGQIHKTWKSI